MGKRSANGWIVKAENVKWCGTGEEEKSAMLRMQRQFSCLLSGEEVEGEGEVGDGAPTFYLLSKSQGFTFRNRLIKTEDIDAELS